MNAGDIFHLGAAILSTTIDDVKNTILAQLGGVQDEYVFSDGADIYGSLGLTSRPAKPTKGQSAAECIAIKGDRDRIIACRDVRGQAIYGNLKEGETCLYGPGEFGTAQGRVIIKQDGSVTMLTTDNNLPPEQGGQAVMLKISPTGGLQFNSQWGSMVLDQTGFHVKTLAGPRIDMGGVVLGPLAAVPGLEKVANLMGGYATISAPIVNVAGSNVMLGVSVPGFPYNAVIGGNPIPGPAAATGTPPVLGGTALSVPMLGSCAPSSGVWVAK